MFGTLMNAFLIERELGERDVIRPFRSDHVQAAQYALTPKEIIATHEDGERRTNLKAMCPDPYLFRSNEYALVVPEESIVLPTGIVGRFIPASGLIELGFGLTLGKLDPGYGSEGEEIRFGIQNLRPHENPYSYNSALAYIEFIDMRGLPATPVESREYDELIRTIRKRPTR